MRSASWVTSVLLRYVVQSDRLDHPLSAHTLPKKWELYKLRVLLDLLCEITHRSS